MPEDCACGTMKCTSWNKICDGVGGGCNSGGCTDGCGTRLCTVC
jgi:hypothetical protein